jgi:hypothetical protein
MSIRHKRKLNIMSESINRLESTKRINKIKLSAIRSGGYAKHSKKILKACEYHLEAYGIDLTPKQLLK